MNMNSTMINTNVVSNYDNNGAIIYTIITLLFYSLSLFCSLILNIDLDDHYDEKKSSGYQKGKNKLTSHSNQADILNTLSDQSLREKYWRIYYGQEELESNKFLSAESKRLSIVSQRMKQLNKQQIKQSSKHEELEELNRIMIKNPQQSPSDPSSFLLKFRRQRSKSIPNVFYLKSAGVHQSLNVLYQTSPSKPPTITLTKCSQ
jgi:hypothetical protein